MIYIINPEFTSENDKDELILAGEWFYYYGNGEYGNAPKKADLKAGDYYGKDGVFPTEYNPSGEETTAESTTEVVTESETTGSLQLMVLLQQRGQHHLLNLRLLLQ